MGVKREREAEQVDDHEEMDTDSSSEEVRYRLLSHGVVADLGWY